MSQPSPDTAAQPFAHAREAEWATVASLTPWPGNPRKNDGEPVDKVAASLIRFGWGNPILARRETREVVAGHTRLKAAKKLPRLFKAATESDRLQWHPEAVRVATEKVVLVRFGDWSEHDAHVLALADNRLGELAEWDGAALETAFADFGRHDMDVAGWSGDASGADGGERDLRGDNGFEYESKFAVIVAVAGEAEQEACFNDLTSRGYRCRLVSV